MNNIIDKVLESNNIVLLCHKNPDGDAIGSSLALYEALKKLGKEVEVIIEDPPIKFNFLSSYKDIKTSTNKDYNLAIILDSANIERVYGPDNILSRVKETIVIDHHISNTHYGTINLVEEYPACCQIIYNLIKNLNIDLDESIASSLLSGLITDTGGFSHQDVKSTTFEVVSELTTITNIAPIYKKVLKSITPNQFQIKKIALANLELYHNNQVAVSYITEEDLQKTNTTQSDCSIIVGIPLEINTIEVSIFIRILKDNLRVSLRSVNIDVNKIAQKFGGGGHINASGVTTTIPYPKLKEELLKEVGVEIEKWYSDHQ